jgi:hypothetical protein
MLPRGTGTASKSFNVPSANSRPKIQLMIRTNKIKPAALINWPNRLR